MSKTRLSLYYLASYLLAGGLGFLVFPQTSLSLLFASGVYSDLMVRMVGTLLIGIGIVVVQIIRLGARELYGTTIILSVMFLSIFTSLHFVYKDPFLLVLLGIVGLGLLLTVTCYILDRIGSGRD